MVKSNERSEDFYIGLGDFFFNIHLFGQNSVLWFQCPGHVLSVRLPSRARRCACCDAEVCLLAGTPVQHTVGHVQVQFHGASAPQPIRLDRIPHSADPGRVHTWTLLIFHHHYYMMCTYEVVT